MSRRMMFAALLALVMSAPAVFAQDKPVTPGSTDNSQNNRGNRGGGGPGGGFDPAQFRQRMLDNVKEQLAASDDEWKVIEPKLTKVYEVQRDSRGGSMFGGFRRSRGGDNSGGTSSADTTRSPVQQASHDLQTVLDKKDATAEEINAKLTAYREAREKAKQSLASAQKDLKDVLTQRQEAVLVNMGMLD